MPDEIVNEPPPAATTEAPAATTETPPAATPPQAAPWAADLEQYITDPTAREQADRYLREKVQPRITQLEDSPAQKLYRDLTSADKQDVTVAAVVQQLYGQEYAEKFVALFGEEGEGLEEGQTIEEGVEEAAAEEDPNAAWVAQKRQEEEQAAEQAEYDAFLDRVVSDEGNTEWKEVTGDPTFALTAEDKPLLAPFMAAAETAGEAVQKYHAYVQQFSTRHGVTPAEAATVPALPPPTLGSSGAPAATPPVETEYKTWDQLEDAVMDYQREQRAKNAPPATL